MTEPVRVLVAVPTFRRPQLLGPLLAEIVRQCAAAGGIETRILVVDNDPQRSAAAAAERAGVAYVHEPTPGIAAVRQHALDAAGDGELVVMVDDDVIPEADWLVPLVDIWRAHRPSAVLGYVRYVWPPGTAPWIVAGGFLRRGRHPTGTALSAFATGNVLIDAGDVRARGVRFDVALGLSGGEDGRFGADLRAAGGTIVACAESVCRDEVPLERTTRAFVRTRTIAHGAEHVRARLRDRRGAARGATRAGALVGGAIRWVLFTGLHLAGRATRNPTMDAEGRRRAWFAAGRMLGGLGGRLYEYAR